LAAAGDEAASLRLVGPHVDARCVPMPCGAAEVKDALRALLHACERQRLIVTEVLGGADNHEPSEDACLWDAVAMAQLEALRADSELTAFCVEG